MFEIESKDPDEVVISTKTKKMRFDLARGAIEAELPVGEIVGPGEFEIGEAAIRGIAAGEQTVYDVVIGNIHVGVIGGCEDAKVLDELGVANVLCTSSVRAVREIEPKIVVALGNVDGMAMELKVAARAEKKLKVKGLPEVMEVVVLT